MALTLKEIADEIGVSKMTVSRVLNGKSHGQVSPELTAKIKSVLAKHNYQPNLNARNLRSAQSRTLPEVKDDTITLLLPCPDFLDRPIDVIMEYVEISNAVIQTASRYDYKVKMLPISRTNDPHDIEWSWLKDLHSGSHVLAYSAWFLPVLTELSRRGCRISMISAEVFWRTAYERLVKDWVLFTYMTVDGCMQLLQHLLEEGYKKNAVASKYVDEPEQPLVQGYENIRSEKGFSYRNVIALPKMEQKDDFAAICAAYKENPFDSLIIENPNCWKLNYQESLQKNIGLPEDVKILFSEDRSDCTCFTPPISSISYPRKEIGKDAVEALLADEFLPGEKFYRGKLVLR